MLDARFSQLYFWPKLKHAAARIACDSGPTCSLFIPIQSIPKAVAAIPNIRGMYRYSRQIINIMYEQQTS